MPLVAGNFTTSTTNPGAALSTTVAHTHNAGADSYLYVVTGSSSSFVTGVTYNGVAMTLVTNDTTTSTASNLRIYRLANPSVGANDVVVSYSSGPFNPVNIDIQSFTGCGGDSQTTFVDTSGPPTSATITVSAKSIILAAAVAGTVGTSAGICDPFLWNIGINNFAFGGLSQNLTEGSRTVTFNASSQIAIRVLEILAIPNNEAILI